MKKEPTFRRCAALALTLVLAALLSAPALALFGSKKAAAAAADEGAPVARELEIATYRNIPYRAQFLSTDPEGEDVTYALDTAPGRGTVEIRGAEFVYTPAEGRTGTDRFTYTATDSAGHVSSPAEVTVRIDKVKSGVTYADTAGSAAAAAAQHLAEEGIFVGARVGGAYFFEPERTVSRGEFLAMTMEAVGSGAAQVTMTGFCDDAAIPAWAKAYAAAGLTDGLVRGVATAGGVAFQGGDPVTYNEAAAILNRALAAEDTDLSAWYGNRESVPSWAEQAVGNLEALSVMDAGSFGSDGLDNSVTRADAARMLAAAQTLSKGEDAGPLTWLTGR